MEYLPTNYTVDDVADKVIEDNLGGGTDTVSSSVTFTLGAFVDNLTLTGALAIDGTGNDLINKITGKPLKPEVISTAWPNLTFTDDPVASSLLTSAKNAEAVGLLKPVDNLAGIYDLSILNEILTAAGQPEVASS